MANFMSSDVTVPDSVDQREKLSGKAREAAREQLRVLQQQMNAIMASLQ
jgi:hypothetical protein